ncbi:MAG: BRCT domain-containing protein, partial [Bacteroidia bacterium]|nr:BRCT domain-containing protein [Bacteroidia bacterium]MDW8135142.1 BRCT domain-containing protein [Bacteroidia bacterium]
KHLLVTGTFPEIPRERIIQYIVANGGIYASGITKKLDYLVVGDNPGPTKLEKAKKLGVRQISLKELQDIVGEPLQNF